MHTGIIGAVLLYAVWPAWMLAGIGDWACHRRTGIEHTSGMREWFYHLVQAAQLGVILLMVTLLRTDPLVLAVLGMLVVAHWVTGYLDARYSAPRRLISAGEQTIHGLLELLPVFAVVLLGIDAALAGRLAAWHWDIHPTDWPPAPALLVLATSILVLGAPLAEEGMRCQRQRQPPRDS